MDLQWGRGAIPPPHPQKKFLVCIYIYIYVEIFYFCPNSPPPPNLKKKKKLVYECWKNNRLTHPKIITSLITRALCVRWGFFWGRGVSVIIFHLYQFEVYMFVYHIMYLELLILLGVWWGYDILALYI